MIRVLVSALLSASAALSQQTFIVDNHGGPGVDFLQLQAAIDAVPDGSVLLVRPSTYGGYFSGPHAGGIITIDGKSISLLATGPGVNLEAYGVSHMVRVANLAVGQSVTLRGFSVIFQSQPQIELLNCAGTVLIEDFHHDTMALSPGSPCDGISITSCAQVTLRNSYLRSLRAVIAQSSDVTIEDCDLIGAPSGFVPFAGAGIQASNSNLVLSRCRVRGSDGPASQQPAILCNNAWIRLCDDGNGSYRAGMSTGTTPLAAIEGTGTVVRDPSAVLVGTHGGGAVSSTMVDIVRPLPSLHTVSAPPGGIVHVDVTTPVGELVLIALAQPGPVTTVPGVDGELWLDPATAALMTFGIPQPGVPVSYSIAVPLRPALVGSRYTWQAVAFSAADGLRASNPSTYSH